MQPNKITLAFTGASGMPYGLRLLECLLEANKEVYLVMSQAAQVVTAMETDLRIPGKIDSMNQFFRERYSASADQITVFGYQQWSAPIASGSACADAMVICPATSGCISAVANGASDNLLERAADVMIKERKPLILAPREMPFSPILLEQCLKLAQMGVTIMPPNPGFYHHPKSVEDLVDFVVARILDHLQVAHRLLPRWGEA